MKAFLRHFLLPHHTNNHRPKLLHHDTLLVLLLFLLSVFLVQQPLQKSYPSVLGISANIAVQDLLTLTNQRRQENGLSPLVLNPQLSEAAAQKAHDMFAKNYWAHIAPDGTTPWYFIKNSGYDYLYAGENLARGFSTSSEVVDAWMASPSHRENMLSPNYNEIGFAISSGSLTGSETVLVVEMFGTPYLANEKQTSPEIAGAVANPSPTSSVIPTVALESQAAVQPGEQTSGTGVAAIQNNPLIDTQSWTRNIAFFLLFLFIGVLVVDLIVIERKQIARVVSHNVDHIIFLLMILIVVIMIGKGLIL